MFPPGHAPYDPQIPSEANLTQSLASPSPASVSPSSMLRHHYWQLIAVVFELTITKKLIMLLWQIIFCHDVMDKCFCQKFFNWPPRSIFDDPHDRYSSALKFDSDRFLRPLEKPKPKIDSDRILSHLSREHVSHLSSLFDSDHFFLIAIGF